jgi:hypothetical protein
MQALAWMFISAQERDMMLDALIICLFLAMVLTPAVVATRNSQGPKSDK